MKILVVLVKLDRKGRGKQKIQIYEVLAFAGCVRRRRRLVIPAAGYVQADGRKRETAQNDAFVGAANAEASALKERKSTEDQENGMAALAEIDPAKDDERRKQNDGDDDYSVDREPSGDEGENGGGDEGEVGEDLENSAGMRKLA